MSETDTIEITATPDCCATTSAPLAPDEAQQLSADLQILGHAVRLQLLTMIARSAEPICVCELETAVPVKQPTVSHHLRLLREAGLIDFERRGVWAYYFVQRRALDALRTRIAGQLALLG